MFKWPSLSGKFDFKKSFFLSLTQQWNEPGLFLHMFSQLPLSFSLLKNSQTHIKILRTCQCLFVLSEVFVELLVLMWISTTKKFQNEGKPHWLTIQGDQIGWFFCQLGYFWRLIMIFWTDEVAIRNFWHFGLLFV